MPIGKYGVTRTCFDIPPNTADLAAKKVLFPRRTLRSRGASTFLPGTSAVELLRGVRASEHARRSLLTTERDGHLLDPAGQTSAVPILGT